MSAELDEKNEFPVKSGKSSLSQDELTYKNVVSLLYLDAQLDPNDDRGVRFLDKALGNYVIAGTLQPKEAVSETFAALCKHNVQMTMAAEATALGIDVAALSYEDMKKVKSEYNKRLNDFMGAVIDGTPVHNGLQDRKLVKYQDLLTSYKKEMKKCDRYSALDNKVDDTFKKSVRYDIATTMKGFEKREKEEALMAKGHDFQK